MGSLGLFWLSRLDDHSGYVTGVLGPIMVIAVGLGLTFVPLVLGVTSGVQPAELWAAAPQSSGPDRLERCGCDEADPGGCRRAPRSGDRRERGRDGRLIERRQQQHDQQCAGDDARFA